jgi:3-oxoacyl-[acyl-carrier protein] reductase/meso-butanediol dehydrogenase/(S,S)-butanediol dehydrogenase/diacetyl reductase
MQGDPGPIEVGEKEMSEFEGKVAIVTGAGRLRGIGRSVALALARSGADLVITGTGRRAESFPEDEKAVGWRDIDSVAEEIERLGRAALALVVDVSSSGDVERMVNSTLSRYGRIDILVNNAAFARGPDRKPVVELPEEIWRKVIDVDLTGTYLCAKAVAKVLISQEQGGKIVNISSLAGKRGRAGTAAYNAAKFGIHGLTQALAHELAPHKINVNTVCPGLVDTSRMDDLGREDRWERYIRETVPLGRAGTGEDIAGLVRFLCSSEADYMTGQAINMGGGRVMH